MAFKFSDRVVYPPHGIGIVEAVEEREVLGRIKKYYIIRIASTKMTAMVPVDSAKDVGIRSIIKKSEISKLTKAMKERNGKNVRDWRLRYQENLGKICNGSIYDIAEVVCNLAKLERKKPLSSSEKYLFDKAKGMLVNEIAMAKEISNERAVSFIRKEFNISNY